MTYIKATHPVIIFLLCSLLATSSFVQADDNILVKIVNQDPKGEAVLGNNELLYTLVNYESDIPLRFQAIALRDGLPLEVGASKNPAVLHAPGSGEALTWVGYNNPTHIDAVRITVFDEGWQELYQLSESANVIWKGDAVAEPREPSEWVTALIKTERRKMDFVYDPSPKKYGLLQDLIFLLTIVSFPAYLLLQLHMLWRYNYRWRELATIPIFPYLILAFYYLFGLDIETSLQVTFLFRYTPLAFLYLVALWCAKRFWQNKLPPPKLYKPPKK